MQNDFRIMIVKRIQELRQKLEAKINTLQERLNKDIEDLKQKQTKKSYL
jgi:hypothetical protein